MSLKNDMFNALQKTGEKSKTINNYLSFAKVITLSADKDLHTQTGGCTMSAQRDSSSDDGVIVLGVVAITVVLWVISAAF